MPDLPEYQSDALSALSTEELVELLVRDEDRVPRNVIDECATRGDAMLDRLQEVVEHGRGWRDDATPGEWWLLLHAGMILGLMPGARTGMVLVQLLRKAADTDDENLEEWLGDCWAALFDNKPPDVIEAVRELANDPEGDWYIRSSAQEPVLAFALKSGTIDRELEWIAQIVSDETEEWTLRLLSASRLLDFPRERYRPLLLALAARQKHSERVFDAEEVEEMYAEGVDRPEWPERDEPWAFYEPRAIAERQRRWAEEDAEEDDEDELDDVVDTYVREGPKIGRNDPCPCGSGKKYKKCCMPA